MVYCRIWFWRKRGIGERFKQFIFYYLLSELDKEEYKKKIGHGYVTGKLFVTYKIMKM